MARHVKTDLDRLAEGVEIAMRAEKRRGGQVFTAQEEPKVIAALAAAERIVAGLMNCAISREFVDVREDLD